MDILKEELVKKRQSLSEETGGRKVFNRSEIEQNRIQKRREEEEEEKRRLCQNPNSSNPSFKPGSSSTSLLPKHEVFRRLRFFKQPVSLFGESDDDRLDRLKYVLTAEIEGQTNDYVVGLKKRRKRTSTDGEGEDENFKRMKTTNFCDLCDEDKIVVYFNQLLTEWKHELDQMTESEKKTAKGKSTLATFKQCKRYLNPLFNLCRNKVLPDEIRQALVLVVKCCIKGDYTAASDHYVRISIGNSPWPIGVTMVGIHERSAREKIHSKSVAHVMNDETTRKYLTSVKRLVTFCERRHPTAS